MPKKILIFSAVILLLSTSASFAEDPPNQAGLERSMSEFQGLIDLWLEQLAELPQKIVGEKIDQGMAEAKDLNTRISDRLDKIGEWFKDHFGGLYNFFLKFNDWIKNHSGWIVDLVGSFRNVLINLLTGLYELFQRVIGMFWRSTQF